MAATGSTGEVLEFTARITTPVGRELTTFLFASRQSLVMLCIALTWSWLA